MHYEYIFCYYFFFPVLFLKESLQSTHKVFNFKALSCGKGENSDPLKSLILLHMKSNSQLISKSN